LNYSIVRNRTSSKDSQPKNLQNENSSTSLDQYEDQSNDVPIVKNLHPSKKRARTSDLETKPVHQAPSYDTSNPGYSIQNILNLAAQQYAFATQTSNSVPQSRYPLM
jgi:hypothetical protein